MTTEMLEVARRYVACGLSVIPIRNGSKQPDGRLLAITTSQPDRYGPNDSRAAWRTYTERMPEDHELRHWFMYGDCGIGIVGGAVSGGLCRIDFEHRACLHTWYQLLFEDSALFDAARMLPMVQTPKGHHVYFRMADPPGHTLLCSGLSGNDQIVFSETQGEGCYCVAPPTTIGEDAYLWCSLTGPEAIPLLDQALATKLLDAARFPGFWQPHFQGPWGGCYGGLSRAGLSLLTGPETTAPGIWLDWPHLTALRQYLARYDDLLAAVESAPPPPPSYDIYSDLDDDDMRGW